MLYWLSYGLFSILFRILFRFKVHGNNNLNEDEGYVICANHSSALDPIFVAIAFKRPIYFIGKAELFKNKILSFLFRKLHAIPIDRQGSDIKALKDSVRIVKDNKLLGVFIEGTRVESYDPANAKSGPILISKMGRSDIIPVQIKTNYKLFSKVDIIIKEKYSYKELSKTKKYEEKAREVLDIIYNG